MNEFHAISLGAGVQSSTMALMAEHGEITPKPDAGIFSDTQDEPKAVYKWLDWLETQLSYPIYRVSHGNLMTEALYMKTSKLSGNSYLSIGLPVYTVDERGNKGMGMRQCTRTFKIDPIRRKLRELRGDRKVIQWIGISFDESQRMKGSRDPWCENRWPLVDLGMTRNDCLEWMKAKGYPEPPRSACKKCPFHSDAEWNRIRSEDPAAFKEAVDFEKQLQAGYKTATALRTVPYLHASRKPLDQVDFNDNQLGLFGIECEGMCGV